MPISEAGLALLREHEGLRLKAYPDPASGGDPWTIAFGHTKGVKEGDTCTPEQAEAWLREDAADAENIVLRHVERPLTQGQLDALVSFVFNVGPGVKGRKDGFVRLKDGRPSTMLRLLNAGDYSGAADQFSRWVFGAGKEMAGLKKRRKAERHLFLSDLPLPTVETLEGSVLSPIASAAIGGLFEVLPTLIRARSQSANGEANARMVEAVAPVVTAAVGARNEQEAVEAIQTDPTAFQKADEAVRSMYYELVEIGGGVQAAREANKSQPPPARNLALWVTALLLPLVYMTVAAVLFGGGWSSDVKAMVVAAVVTGALGGITAYWLGTSASSSKKTDLLASK